MKASSPKKFKLSVKYHLTQTRRRQVLAGLDLFGVVVGATWANKNGRFRYSILNLEENGDFEVHIYTFGYWKSLSTKTWGVDQVVSVSQLTVQH